MEILDSPPVEHIAILKERTNITIFLAAEAARIVGILLQPYMPDKAAQLLDTIGVSEDRRTFAHAELGCDDSYGIPKIPVGTNLWEGLFPPLLVEK